LKDEGWTADTKYTKRGKWEMRERLGNEGMSGNDWAVMEWGRGYAGDIGDGEAE
jgi:hypothetical protein